MSKDLFSKQAGLYAGYRPGYPPELIDYVISGVRQRNLAWDCATGNGQAAVLLAPYFKKIIATDLSREQIRHAIPHPSIEYQVAGADSCPCAEDSTDLITVAQAYHWLASEAFWKEAIRAGKKGSLLAVWGYSLAITGHRSVQEKLDEFYSQKVGKYWDPERRHVEQKYLSLPFPFRELPSREFAMDVYWTLQEFSGYLRTWSAVQHFIDQNNRNPVDEFIPEIREIWPDDTALVFSFPIFLRMGRIEK